jgi:hypothetical protein
MPPVCIIWEGRRDVEVGKKNWVAWGTLDPNRHHHTKNILAIGGSLFDTFSVCYEQDA